MIREDIVEVVRNSVSEVVRVPVSEIGDQSDFFHLGLDSILMIRLVTRLQERFHMKFSIMDFFVSPSVNGVVDMIEAKVEMITAKQADFK